MTNFVFFQDVILPSTQLMKIMKTVHLCQLDLRQTAFNLIFIKLNKTVIWCTVLEETLKNIIGDL